MTWYGRLCAGLLLAVVASASRAGAHQMTAEYDVRFGPLTIMSLRATTEFADGRYRTTTEGRTVGVAALVFPWQASATTEGRIEEGGLRPLTHRSNGVYRGQHRSVTIDYDAGGAVVAAIDPPAADDYRDAVPVALQQATVDPLTATLTALASHCHGTVPVFDGRRRYNLRLADLGDAEAPSAHGALYVGPARRCRSAMEAIAGFWRTGPQHDERPSHLDSWIAAPQPGLPPIPVCLELANHRGTLSIYLTAVRADPSDAVP
jgi:Protein of unknown function (DUF3108)